MSRTNIRDNDLLGPFIGCTLVDVTQHDDDEFLENGESRVYLHFSNGAIVSFVVGEEGFDVETIDP
jgi:hypothetical protein